MMQETLEPYDKVPKLLTFKEKLFAHSIALILSYAYFLISLIIWWQVNWYMALSTLFLLYIVSGIVSSKLLHLYVPYKQHEFNYSSLELASWMIAFYRSSI